MTLMGGAFYGCSDKSIIDYSKNKRSNASKESASRAVAFDVKIQNDKLVIQGKDLEGVKKITVKNTDGFNETFEIESISSSEIIASGLRNFSIAIGKAFSLVLADAHGSSTFAISFSLEDGQVTAQKLSDMGAGDGDVLIYNQTSERWEPRPLSGLNLVGTWDANGNIPTLNDGGHLTNPLKGDYYVVSASGTIPLDGESSWNVGDWVIFNGQTWAKINNTADVQSFAGRQGVITPDEGDYSLDQMSDVDTSAAAEGKVLKYISGEWVAADDLQSGGAGSVTSAEIADGSVSNDDLAGSIDQSKITNLSSDISSINSNVSDNASDIATNTSDIATNLSNITNNAADILTNTNDIGTNTTAIGAINTALGGKQDTIGDGDLTIARTSGLQTALDDKLDDSQLSTATDLGDTSSSDSNIPSQLAVKTYVDTEIAGVNSSQWTTSGSDIYYNSGNVGIGTTAPSESFVLGDDLGDLTSDTALVIGNNTGNSSVWMGASSSNWAGLRWNNTNKYLQFNTSNEGTVYTSSMVIKDGNVGIGTTNPEGILEINRSGTETSDPVDNTGTCTLGTSTTSTDCKCDVGYSYSDTNTDGIYDADECVANDDLFIVKNGNVGIGTSTPSEKLDVDGNVKATAFIGDGSQLTGITSDSSENTADAVISADSDSSGGGDILFNTAGTTKASISNEGDMTLGAAINSGSGVTSFSVGSTTEPSVISLGEDSDNNAAVTWNNTDNYVSIGTRSGATDYTDTLVVKDGKVGVGTIDPTDKLSVIQNQASSTTISVKNSDVLGNARLLVSNDDEQGYIGMYGNSSTDHSSKAQNRLFFNSTSGMSFRSNNGNFIWYNQGISSSGYESLRLNRVGGNGNSRLGIGVGYQASASGDYNAYSPSYNLSFGSYSTPGEKTIGVERQVHPSIFGGYALGIYAGGASTGETDINGGDLNLNSGVSTGTGSSAINFKTSTAGVSGTTDNNPSTKMTITGEGHVGIGTTNPTSLLHLFSGSGNLTFDPEVDVTSLNPGSTTSAAVIKGTNGRHLILDIPGNDSGDSFAVRTSNDNSTTINNVAMVVKNDGNVGIGTTSPEAKLHVYGTDAKIERPDGNPQLLLSRDDATITAGDAIGSFVFSSPDDAGNDTSYALIEALAEDVADGSEDGSIRFRGQRDGVLAEHMRILGNGNVGIGTTAPSEALQVEGNIESSGLLRMNTLASGNGVISFDGSSYSLISNNSSAPMIFSTNSSEQMRITSSGNVGIGTTAPSEKLEVTDGSIAVSSGVQSATYGMDGILRYDSGGDDLEPFKVTSEWFSVYTGTTGTAGAEALRVNSLGDLGVGTIAPEAKVQITGGGLCVGSDADCNTDNDTEGNIYASTTSITGADYAEYFYSEGRLQAGDLVGLNPKTGLARYYQKGDKLLGIASTKPGVVGNRKLKDADNTVLVALLGQVPVNAAQVVEEDRVVRTLDGKTIGHRLHSGDVYVNISSVDEEQSRKIASLESENNEIKLENKQMRKELDELKGLFKELSRKLEEKQSAQ